MHCRFEKIKGENYSAENAVFETDFLTFFSFFFLETWSTNVLMCLSLKHFGSLNKPDSQHKAFFIIHVSGIFFSCY